MSDQQFVHQPDEVQLAKLLRESRPFLERYGTALIYGVALLLAVAAVFIYVARRPPATAEESAKLLKAETPEEFSDIALNAPGTPIGLSASLREGEMILQNALRNLFTNRKVGLEELDQAEKIYRRLEDEQSLDEHGRLKVTVGLARILEARCDGSDSAVKSAVDAWEKVLKTAPDSKLFSALAEDRKKKLALPATKEFYAWFQQQNPAPGDTLGLPQDGPGAVPAIPGHEGLGLQGLIPSLPTQPAPAAPTEPAAPETPAEPAAPAAPQEGEKTADPPAPDAPAPDAPAPDAPTPDAPTPDSPAPDAPAPDAPKTDAPASEQPAPDAPPQPAPDAPKTGE
jgi:hypothetical protein